MMLTLWLRQKLHARRSSVRGASGRTSRSGARGRRAARVEQMETRTLLTVFVVDSTLDGPLATLRANNTTELREAIEDARLAGESESHTIRFASSIDGQTIKLTHFLNDLSAGSTMPGPSGLFIQDTSLTIDGETGLTKGITIAREETAAAFRILFIGAGADVTLKGLTLKGGLAKGGNGGSFYNASAGGAAGLGGGIYNDGRLDLQNSTLTGNKAQGGSAAQGRDGPQGSGGGGLGANGDDLTYSVPENGANGGGPNGGAGGSFGGQGGNGGFGGGGGGGQLASHLGIILSKGPGGHGGFGGGGGSGAGGTITQGENGGNGGFGGGGGGAGGGSYYGASGAGGFGGGNAIASTGGGGAGMGGAIFNKAGSVSITNSTLTGNSALGGTGGNAGQGLGGAVFNYNGSLAITFSTLSLNTAANGGRAVYNRDDSATLVAAARINNSILAQADTAVDDFTATGTGLTSGIGNLIGRASGFSGSFITGDPKLGALQDNGGRTHTLALAADSPAVNAANADAFRNYFDQRGVARDVSAPDIGAFELVQKQAQTISFAALSNRTYGDADFALSATSSSGLPVSVVASGDATVYQAGGVWYVSITGAGSATITAFQDGNDKFQAATDVDRTFTIARAATTTTTRATGPYVYTGDVFIGGTGTVTGPAGLEMTAVSYVYSANADGTGEADLVNAGTYYVAATFAGDANYLPSTGPRVAIVIGKAHATVNVAGYSGTYDGVAHGATGTAVGWDGASVGTLNLGATFTNAPGGTANWTFDGGRNYFSQRGSVAIQIVAKRLTGSFTVANKVYDGKTSATVTSRTLAGVIGTDAVTLVGGAATFASKNAGTHTVTLAGATLSGAAARNYVLDSVAKTTATITPKALTGVAAGLPAINVASNGILPVLMLPSRSGIVDGQSIERLFEGAMFSLSIGGRTYSARAEATVVLGVIAIGFRMTPELKALLAANTTAKNAAKAPTVAFNFSATSKDGNYVLNVTACAKLFNTSR